MSRVLAAASVSSVVLLCMFCPSVSAIRALDPQQIEKDTHTSSRRPFALVEPVESHTKLSVSEEGLEALRSIPGPVVPVVVIGPYRSGKSFLLNQLLGVGCTEGFGVGHTRSTQTKGVWVWGEPQRLPLEANTLPDLAGQEASIVYLDTEGFESTGKADAYDDRIFALSTLISAVLVYNLPETVRESDIQKLSFAVELAEGFYADVQGGGGSSPVEPGNMLWLIQRDFLEGKTVQDMVSEALQPVANPYEDQDIAQVNKIRQSLRLVARNSTAFGLHQPHMERTKLCELADDQLDSQYIQQRSGLRELVQQLAKPKRVNGKVMTGPALAELVSQMVTALNARDIPTAGSILEHFNKELVYRVRDSYIANLESLALPVSDDTLAAHHEAASAAARKQFQAEKFGNDLTTGLGSLQDMLQASLDKEFLGRQTGNTLESNRRCEKAETECEDSLEREQLVRLPSTGRFEDRFSQCQASFERVCIGPAHTGQSERLQKAWRREHTRFKHDYNDKLYNGLVLLLLVDILMFRFVIKFSVLESLGWVVFLFLQVYPKLYLNGGSMYEAHWWAILVRIWEMLVYNPLLDLEKWWQILTPVAIVSFVAWKVWVKCIRPRWKRRQDKKLMLPTKQGTTDRRDLSV